jgi:hypothetical protein
MNFFPRQLARIAVSVIALVVLEGAVGGKQRNVALPPQQFKSEKRMAAKNLFFFQR